MNKTCFFIICFFSLSICCKGYSQLISKHNKKSKTDSKISKQKKDELQFEFTSFDFGSILEGEEVSILFPFVNNSDNEIEVVNVKKSCGCTTIDFPRKIKPGQSGNIFVVFNSRGREGFQEKHIYLTFSGNSKKDIILTIKGDIEPVIILEPNSVFFEKLEKGEKLTKNVKLTINPEAAEDIDILEAKSSHPGVNVSYKKLKDNCYLFTLYADYGLIYEKEQKRYQKLKKMYSNYQDQIEPIFNGIIILSTNNKRFKNLRIYFAGSLDN